LRSAVKATPAAASADSVAAWSGIGGKGEHGFEPMWLV
jgi:hypothetical protein